MKDIKWCNDDDISVNMPREAWEAVNKALTIALQVNDQLAEGLMSAIELNKAQVSRFKELSDEAIHSLITETEGYDETRKMYNYGIALLKKAQE